MKMKIILALVLVFTVSACGGGGSSASTSAQNRTSTENRTVVIPEIEMEFVSRIPNFNATINTTSIPQPGFDASAIDPVDGADYVVYFNITERGIVGFESERDDCGAEINGERVIPNPNILIELNITGARCPPDAFGIRAVSVPHAEIYLPYNSTGNEQNNNTYWYAFDVGTGVSSVDIVVTTNPTSPVELREFRTSVLPASTTLAGEVEPSLGFAPITRTYNVLISGPDSTWFLLQVKGNRDNFYLIVE